MTGTSCQTPCGWSPLDGGIAKEKLRQYLAASKNNSDFASEMFHLDGEVAAAFLEPIRLIELVLREAIHRRVSDLYGSKWMLDPTIIDGRSIEKVTHSIGRIENLTSSDKIVSDLNLGFWAGLFQKGGPGALDPNMHVKHSATLWNPALSKIFKGGHPSRRTAATLILRISYLRNRIAHHEPILFGITQPGSRINNRQIKQEPINVFQDLTALGNFLDPELGKLLKVRFRVAELLTKEVSQKAIDHAKSRRDLYWI